MVRITVSDAMQLGQEFFRWEMATAVAGSIIGINPFDQPDVEASKVKTRDLTTAYEKTGSLPDEKPFFSEAAFKLFADPRNEAELAPKATSLTAALKAHLVRIGAGDYAALLAYIERNPAHIEAMQNLRRMIRDRTKAATCVGFGPRFLHSTGQAYKGGPNSGVFLQITCDDPQICRFPVRNTHLAWSRRRRRAAISKCWPNAAGVRCGSIFRAVSKTVLPHSAAQSSRLCHKSPRSAEQRRFQCNSV